MQESTDQTTCVKYLQLILLTDSLKIGSPGLKWEIDESMCSRIKKNYAGCVCFVTKTGGYLPVLVRSRKQKGGPVITHNSRRYPSRFNNYVWISGAYTAISECIPIILRWVNHSYKL